MLRFTRERMADVSRPPPLRINNNNNNPEHIRSRIESARFSPVRSHATRRARPRISRKDYNMREYASPNPKDVIMPSQYEKNVVLGHLERLGGGINNEFVKDFRSDDIYMFTPKPKSFEHKKSPFFYIIYGTGVYYKPNYMYDIVRNHMWEITKGGKFQKISGTNKEEEFVPKYRTVGFRLIQGGGMQTRRR